LNHTVTRVEICFYDPSGFPDTHDVITDDHGVRVLAEMKKYPAEMLRRLKPEMLRRLKYGTAKLQDGSLEPMRNSDQC
jgi:hypothetical protein